MQSGSRDAVLLETRKYDQSDRLLQVNTLRATHTTCQGCFEVSNQPTGYDAAGNLLRRASLGFHGPKEKGRERGLCGGGDERNLEQTRQIRGTNRAFLGRGGFGCRPR